MLAMILLLVIVVSAQGYIDVGVSGGYCGDGQCQVNRNENCSNCPGDCGECIYCGDGICNGAESCSDCPADCGACSRGGGGGVSRKILENIVVTPIILEVPLIQGSFKTRTFKIENKGLATSVINISLVGLESYIKIKKEDTSFILKSGKSKEITIEVYAPEKPGIYTGKILVNNKEVNVILNVDTKKIIIDLDVEIEKGYEVINPRQKLPVIIRLQPLEKIHPLNITLEYIVKDFENNIHHDESETMIIGEEEIFRKSFSTDGMAVGEYIIGVKIIYEGEVSTESKDFKIKDFLEIPRFLELKVIIDIIIFILIFIILVILISHFKKHKE